MSGRERAAPRGALLPLLFACLLATQPLVVCEVSGDPPRLAPWFTAEPPPLVQFAASRGARVRCAARGTPPPTVLWLSDDGTPLTDTPGLRRIYSNGTLEVLPASGSAPAAATLRCRAANAHGVALSRDLTLLPVSDVNWEAVLVAAAAWAGGVAALTCRAADSSPHVRPAVWYRGDTVLDVHAPTAESRYVVAGDTLLVRDVSAADAGPYSCVARHALTALTKRSRPVHLAVAPGPSNSAPRVVASANEVSVAAGADFCIPCVASEYPPPHYTWYREMNGRLQPVEPSGGRWWWAGGAALCFSRASPAAGGAWLCKAYNVYGDATKQMRLHVDGADDLAVTVAPAVLVADTGSTARLNCSASDPSGSITWLHDGVAAGSGPELVLRAVTRSHRGLYQCFARRGSYAVHASAELRLGDSAPELHYTFIEQALRAGGGVSLRCAAAGSPAPRLAWLLDSQPLDQYRAQHRYFINEEISVNGDVVSTLNISSVSPEDGGRYTCRAQNQLGQAEHSARLNIYGPPSIRALGPIRVVAGANATIFCPYAGYPISSVWWRRGAGRAVGGAGRVSARGAELRLAPALAADAGRYACEVAAPAAAARADLEIQVRNPPKISPFMFSSELTEGSSVQVLCGVSSGDKPMYFSWLKDGAPLSSNLQIEEKSLNEFSLLMFSDLTARHSGDYTCRVTNHAATVNYTATLSVKVTPAWTTEPMDAAILLGAPLSLQCAAKGYPVPKIKWYRRIGDSVSLNNDNEDHWEIIGGSDWGDGVIEVRTRNGTLGAPAASRLHQGQYRCVADNGVGPPLIKHINLTIHEPAHFEESSGNMSCVRGHSVSLTCHALGDAPLTVHWTHQGTRIDLNSYRWSVSEVRTVDGLRSSLQFRAAESTDAGEYRCHAHNQYGRSELLLFLHVEEPPEAPRSLHLGGVGSRWVRVTWRAPSTRGLSYSASFTALQALPTQDAKHITTNLTLDSVADERADTDGHPILSARLESLHPSVAYSLRLTATNHIGQSPQSEPLLFTTLEEAPSASPQNVQVRSAGVGELHITWSAPPQDSWNGELLGYVVSWRELSRVDEEGNDEERRAGSSTAPGWTTADTTISGLRSFSRYALTLRAYNRAGAGPPTPTMYATTADGVPEVAPTAVVCEGLSSRSLRVRWSPPQPAHAHVLRGYDVQYATLHFSPLWSGAMESQTARTGANTEATLQGLRAATNYSVWVRARTDRGLGPPSAPIYCSTREDVPGAVEAVRALASSSDTVRVSWLAPSQRAGRLTHYTLYTRELGKVGGEWSQRVEANVDSKSDEEIEEEEVWREVVGLRERTVYEFWVRAATAAGAGPPTRPVTAAPARAGSARISSLGRVVHVSRGARVRLRCAAVGAPPLRWRWSPAPPPHAHTVTDDGDLVIHKVEVQTAGNYTCSVRNSGGADAAVYTLAVRRPPAAPAPRLVRADRRALHLAWDAPPDGGAALLGYTVWWSREGGEGSEGRSEPRSARVPAGDTAHALAGLACGALYRVTLRAHNAVGASPHSRPLLARTRGDKAKAPPGKEFVWANSTALRLNLLAWGGRCPVAAWTLALRPAAGGGWTALHTNGETAESGDLQPGTWYEIRVVARAPAGDTHARYKAATHTRNGERVGEPTELPLEARGAAGGGGAARGAEAAATWRAPLTPLLLAAALAAALTALTALAGVVLARRRRAALCERRECSPRRPHPQLYSTEPGNRNGKTLTPPHSDDMHEISPYATFSMTGGGGAEVSGGAGGAGGAGGGCALHLRTFARAESLDLAAPPPRPNLLTHSQEYGRCRDSDSESSGSPCAACAAELYRLPAAHLSDTLPAVESSADDTSYSAGSRARHRAARGRRRRDHSRHSAPTVR
ncbi:cell adhesion molecule Dscam2-like [Achroia grisella]|uniref:cell adhesion molecule Dscam2-like n=1 Tax=Achroia grisella TaxID=688607 RepID=UPI0027D2C9EB|nr:cell adhesion molecule Dscam2-like [Achroia grisella]